jgi:CII-binding regulator of phage lambda lysogenization HflD
LLVAGKKASPARSQPGSVEPDRTAAGLFSNDPRATEGDASAIFAGEHRNIAHGLESAAHQLSTDSTWDEQPQPEVAAAMMALATHMREMDFTSRFLQRQDDFSHRGGSFIEERL